MRRVALLCTDTFSGRVVHHALYEAFGDVATIVEDRMDRATLLRGRVRRLGLTPVLGQVLFLAALAPWLERASAPRKDELVRRYRLHERAFRRSSRVPSVNTAEAREALKTADPLVVVVMGTRIIGRETLRATNATFVNLHAGITPYFRGGHGGYWALRERRPDLIGSTVHLVDEGIDTGGVLGRAYFQPSTEDSYATYPVHHLGVGVPQLISAVSTILETGHPDVQADLDLPSRLWHHPSLGGYLYHRIWNGVK